MLLADVAQWQSNAFVKRRLWVQFPPSAQKEIVCRSIIKIHIKTKSCIAEMYVVARLIGDGWKILNPIGENNRHDLIAERKGKFIIIQVKYVTPNNGVLNVNCRSNNNWSVLHYSSEEIDVIAVFNSENKSIYYIPVLDINHSLFKLRIKPAKNKQKMRFI